MSRLCSHLPVSSISRPPSQILIPSSETIALTFPTGIPSCLSSWSSCQDPFSALGHLITCLILSPIPTLHCLLIHVSNPSFLPYIVPLASILSYLLSLSILSLPLASTSPASLSHLLAPSLHSLPSPPCSCHLPSSSPKTYAPELTLREPTSLLAQPMEGRDG